MSGVHVVRNHFLSGSRCMGARTGSDVAALLGPSLVGEAPSWDLPSTGSDDKVGRQARQQLVRSRSGCSTEALRTVNPTKPPAAGSPLPTALQPVGPKPG